MLWSVRSTFARTFNRKSKFVETYFDRLGLLGLTCGVKMLSCVRVGNLSGFIGFNGTIGGSLVPKS